MKFPDSLKKQQVDFPIFQGLIKSNVEFPWVTKKNHVEYPGVLVLGFKISVG